MTRRVAGRLKEGKKGNQVDDLDGCYDPERDSPAREDHASCDNDHNQEQDIGSNCVWTDFETGQFCVIVTNQPCTRCGHRAVRLLALATFAHITRIL